MVRKSIYITKDLDLGLKHQVKVLNETESTIIRLALREYLKKEKVLKNGKDKK